MEKANNKASAGYQAYVFAEMDQIALATAREGWGDRWPEPTTIVHNEASTISEWAHLRTAAIYPYPSAMPPKPKEPWLKPAAVLFLSAPILFSFLLVAIDMLGVVAAAALVVWMIACGLASSHRNATNEYWKKYDPDKAERERFYAGLEFSLKNTLRHTAREYSKPVVTIPPAEVHDKPRGSLAWEPQGPRPEPLASCSPRQAEHLAAQWMAFLGATRVRVSQATRDGGVDVTSDYFVAEVKHRFTPSSPDLVRQIFGVATVENKKALFFSLSGYTADAIAFADKAKVALFVYNPTDGTLAGESASARLAVKKGLVALL